MNKIEYKTVEFFSCPLCGFGKPINKKIKGGIKFNIDFEKNGVIQIREVRGRKGFPIVKRIKIKDMVNDENYKEILKELTIQVEKLYNYLKRELK